MSSPTSTDAEKLQATTDFLRERDSLVALLTDPKVMPNYVPVKQFTDVQQCLDSVNTDLSLSAVGTKLDRISNGKVWFC
ncbi:MAG TPA: hypothetical protein VMB52_01840 [Verrucomicrobiae bacterium]|nr:hypothetical protein [Verrucomicrobiae bacterium]